MHTKEISLAICLFEMIDEQNLSNVISLMRQRANPNTIIPKLNIAPIHYAVGFENDEFAGKVTEILLENNADANLPGEDRLTPLHIACIWGREKIVKMLLENGGDLDKKCKDDMSAISHAIREDHYEVIEVIKKFIFERKMDTKRKELKTNGNTGIDLMMKNRLLQNLEEKQFTPNRINYNFDVTSPFYVNITHRKHKTSSKARKKLEIDDGPEMTNDSSSEHNPDQFEEVDEKKNIFELTESNLKEFSKHMNVAIVVSRLAIHKRISYIKKWQESIRHLRKSDLKLDMDYIDYLNKCNDVKVSVNSKTFEDEESEESFFTATTDFKMPQNAQQDVHEKRTFIEESYVHSDIDGGVIFYEKKLVAPNEVDDGESDSSYLTELSLPPVDYDTDVLRRELTKLEGVTPVINLSTKKLYLKKLVKLRNQIQLPAKKSETKMSKVFSQELQRAIANLNILRENLCEWLELESRMSRGFIERSNIKWREGNLKTSFIYFLIDPRVSDNLALNYKNMSKELVWHRFLESIFYVGKGKRSRPYQHLYDAIKLFANECDDKSIAIRLKQNLRIDALDLKKNGKIEKLSSSKKIRNIIDIWKSKKGVVCLHIFNNIMPVEAYTREAAIIEAIGLENLSNMKKGEYYGAAKSFSMRQKRQLGIALISRALRIFLAEGESQLLPFDIIDVNG